MNHEQRPPPMIEALTAPGPAPEYAEKLTMFGRYRWTFSDVTADSFHWRGYWSDDDGQTWHLDEEMFARRRPG